MSSLRTTDKELQRLRQSCRLALERYLDLASRESGRLTSLTPKSISQIDRANLLLLSQKEEAAHRTYRAAKAALRGYLGALLTPDADDCVGDRASQGRKSPSVGRSDAPR